MTAVGLTVLLWQAVPALRGNQVLAVGVVGLLVGVPLGAVDFLLPQRGANRPRGAALLVMVWLYITAFAVGLLLIFMAPVVAYFLIIAGAVAHWGAGDAVVRRERRGERPRLGSLVEAIAYGSSIIFTGAVFWPSAVDQFLNTIAPGTADAAWPVMVAGMSISLVAMAAFAMLMIVRREWMAVSEMVLLAGMGLTGLAVPGQGTTFPG